MGTLRPQPKGKKLLTTPYLGEWLPVFPTPFNRFVPTGEKIHLNSFHFWVK
jgi:hypothetical protein